MTDFSTVKGLYEDGYRCIYYDGDDANKKLYLKNFDSEHSTEVELDSSNDFSLFQSYVSSLR